MKIKVAHLLFEQSGAFKAGFGAFNIPAIDYDLENRFAKPTLYYFVNCEPYYLYPDLRPKDASK